MNILQNNPQDSKTKRRLVLKIKGKYPNISEKELNNTLRGVKRFVELVQKIQTEPQAQISYPEKTVNGKIIKTKETNLDYLEFIKVKEGNEQNISITEAMKRLSAHYPERKDAKRRKKI